MYQATKAGFSGGVVVDYPNSTKAKKYYLCLFAGVQATNDQMPTGNFFSTKICTKLHLNFKVTLLQTVFQTIFSARGRKYDWL